MHTRQRYWFIFAILFVLLSIGLGRWVWSSVLSLQNAAQNAMQQPTEIPYQAPPITPTPDHFVLDVTSARLIIPVIGVNAPIETVGKTIDGRMDVPTKNQWNGVGWYKDGPTPGDAGSAVIDGHLDRPGGGPAVFWRLKDLHVGDVVSLKDNVGHLLRFKVMQVANYAPESAPLDQIFGKNDGTFLNLITCAGVWIPTENQTSQRLVVFTKMIA